MKLDLFCPIVFSPKLTRLDKCLVLIVFSLLHFFTGSQELHMAQPPNPAFNKFNSLDRRALARRQNINGGTGPLKLAPSAGPESLPVTSHNVRLTGPPVVNANSAIYGDNLNTRLIKEPERRHSSYDSSTSRSHSIGGSSGSTVSRISTRNSGGTGNTTLTPGVTSGPGAININGLPDPFGGPSLRSMAGSVYSSQESLHRGNGSTTPLRPTSTTSNSSQRPGAGTPQFQNLSGTIRTTANGLMPNTGSSTSTPSAGTGSATSRTTLSSLFHRDNNNAGGKTNVNATNSGGESTASSSSGHSQDMNQTPSPSDSAVGDLETMLKEKDTEINYLRETMEHNEQVIFKVCFTCIVHR